MARLTRTVAIPALLAMAGMAGMAVADFDTVTAEIVDVGAPVGHTTYRLYANFTEPTDQLIAVSAEALFLYFSTNLTLANDGGPFAGLKQEDFAQQPVSATWDSYVTIDADAASGNDTNYRPGFLGSDGRSAVVVGQTWQQLSNGGWFDSNPATPAVASDDLRVFIAQFTVEEGLDGASDVVLQGSIDWQPAPGVVTSDPFLLDTSHSVIAGACCFASGVCRFMFDEACAGFGGVFQGPVACSESICLGGCCAPGGSCVVQSADACGAAGGVFAGHGSTCDDLDFCDGACCLPGGVCQEDGLDECVGAGGVFLGLDVPCDAGACDGACCQADGTCFDSDPDGCAAQDGTFGGLGSACDQGLCTGACCLVDGSCVNLSEDDCATVRGLFQGTFTSCVAVDCPQPTGACCFEDGSCTNPTQDVCTAAGGVWQGAFVSCRRADCPQPEGACCRPDSVCVVSTLRDCLLEGGVYGGDNSACSPSGLCPGACCLPTGVPCEFIDEEACRALGGSWQGAITSCAGGTCVTGACCLADSSCVEVIQSDCRDLAGVFGGDRSVCAGEVCSVACCLGDGTCQDLDGVLCGVVGGLSQGRFTECKSIACAQPTGACCLADLACEELVEAGCAAASGMWMGAATFCAGIDCASTNTPNAFFEIVDVGAPAGFTTYRIYATFFDPLAQALAFGTDGTVLPLFFETNIGLLNEGGAFAGFKQEDFAQPPVSASYDSYVTIDAEEAAGNDTDYRPNFLGGDGISAVVIGRTWQQNTNAGWFDSQPGTPALAGDDLRVLLAQFTVENEADGSSFVVLSGTLYWELPGGSLTGDPFILSTTGDVALSGACCLPETICLDSVTEAACADRGGIYQGPGSGCAGDPCRGVCCLSNGGCVVDTGSFGCADITGTFMSSASSCLEVKCPCRADVNGSFVVNFQDLVGVLSRWGECGPASCPEDVNGDVVVNTLDLLIVLSGWGPCQ